MRRCYYCNEPKQDDAILCEKCEKELDERLGRSSGLTREEAIEIFREWINEGFPFDGGYAVEELNEDEKEALKMAISALEQDKPKQPDICPIYDGTCAYPIEFCSECPRHTKQEPCDDAISREAVIKIIDGWYEQNRDTENIEDLIILITYMGSVQPSRKGHWEYFERPMDADTMLSGYKCSECNYEIGKFYKADNNFCPNCGARMVEPQESEEQTE